MQAADRGGRLDGRARARALALVERERELLVIDQALQAAPAGGAAAVLVEGAAGLGKSRLLAEASANAQAIGMTVLSARAIPTEVEFPFAVTLALLETSLARADPPQRAALLAGSAGLAGPLLGSEDPTGRRRSPSPMLFSTLHGLYWLVVNLSARSPVLLCVDDLHWSDDPSLRFLLYLAQRLDGLPVTLIMSARPAPAGGDGAGLAQLRCTAGVRRLRLDPLRPEGVATIVRAALPDADDAFCATCAEVAHGNPFHVQEVLSTVSEQGLAATGESSAAVRGLAGAAIAQAALFRLIRTGSDGVALGRALAVMGDGASLRHVAALSELDIGVAAAAVDVLAAEDVVAVGEPLRFVHPLVGEQIYRELPAQGRGVAHLRAARLLADDGAGVQRIAAQLLAAPGTGDPWVVDVLRTAARRANAEGASQAAARQLQRALDEPPSVADRGEVLAELGAAEAAAGLGEAAVAHLIEALELQCEPRARVAAARTLSRALAGVGRAPAAADALERELSARGDEDASEETYALIADHLAVSMFEPGLRQRAFARVRPLLDSAPSGGTASERRLLAAMATRRAQEAAPAAEVVALADRAWAQGALLDDEGPDAPGWLMVAWALALAEDYARARAVTSAVVDRARLVGSVHAFANAIYFRGDACYREGRVDDAQAEAELAIEAGHSGWRRYLGAARVLRANTLIERDELDAAEATLALADEQDGAPMMDVAWRLHARGRLELARAQPVGALEHLEAAGRWLRERLQVEHTVLPWRADAALAALACGDRDRARGLIEPSLATAQRAGTQVIHGRRLRVLGLVEGGADGIERLRRSVRLLAGTQALLEHAYALADLGAALRRGGLRTEGRAALERALDGADRCGARRLGARVRDELLAAGARPRRARISGPDALTPSEQRVARLAARGMTNPQVAQALFVTPKTVEFHLRHVYQKLSLEGRAGLAEALGAAEAL